MSQYSIGLSTSFHLALRYSERCLKSLLYLNLTLTEPTVMLTLLLPRDAKSFRISHQEMIKGIRLGGHGKTLRFFDTLEVPIIENTADEEDLTSGMAEAMDKFPDAGAILVRRHGVYIWGERPLPLTFLKQTPLRHTSSLDEIERTNADLQVTHGNKPRRRRSV